MRKLIGAAAVAMLVGTGLAGVPAAGATPHRHVRTVEFTGHSTFDSDAVACPATIFPHQTFDATITTKRGATLHIDGCDDLNGGTPFPFTGSFTITSANGRRSLSGTVTGTAVGPTDATCASGLPGGIDFDLTPVRHHGKPGKTITIDGLWCSLIFATGELGGPISGTISGALPPWLR